MPILRNKAGKAVQFAQKPNLAKLQKRYGSDTQVKRTGDGKWVVQVVAGQAPGAPAPGAPGAAPEETPSPGYAPGGPANFDFASAASPAAQNEIADLIAGFKTATGGSLDANGNFVPGETGGTIGAQFDQLVKNLQARRPMIEDAQRQGLQSVASTAAARGISRSGLKEVDDQAVRTNAMNQLNETERQLQQAGTDRATALSEAASRFLQGKKSIETQAAADWESDRMSNFQDSFGGVENAGTVGDGALGPPDTPPGAAPPAATAPKVKPVKKVTYPQFVKSHGGQSTGKLARAWDKRFNQGRRFGYKPPPPAGGPGKQRLH